MARVGNIVAGYHLVDVVWQGSTSTVYLARAAAESAAFGPLLAVKILSSRRTSAVRIKQFKREAALTAGLDHPNIIKVYQYLKTGDEFLILMEYVKGRNLRRLSLERQLGFAEIVLIFTRLLSGLKYLESRKIIHKDIKPENIMVADDLNQVKLMDFGYAVKRSFFRFDPFPYAGTEQYFAPERKNGRCDYRSDLYSLGRVVEELVMKIPDAPDYLHYILASCTQESPEKRAPDADSILRQLERFSSALVPASAGAPVKF